LRKSLVAVQFVIAQVLVIVTIIVLQQLNFFRNAPMGFDKDSILLFWIPSDSAHQAQVESLRNALLQRPEIKNVTFSFTAPLSGSNRTGGFQFNGSIADAPFEANVKYADVNFFKTYSLSLAAGRVYQPSDAARECVVNQTFLKKLGIKNPEEGLGKTVTWNGTALPIVGVIKDFHLRSLQSGIEPLILMCNRAEYHVAGIKIENGKIKEGIQAVEKIYTTLLPENIFEYRFLDENVALQYAAEEDLSTVTEIFSGIALFISCLGLYGLISFMAVQRTKEVGLRKVLGASIADILVLFYKEFIFLVLLAFLISAPLSWYLMSDWLNSFAYRIRFSAWTFVLAIGMSIVIAVITISFQSVKAALANPVDSLRNE